MLFRSVSTFMNITLKFYQVNNLCRVFLGFILFFHLEHVPLSHVLIFCVCFYELGEIATFPNLEGVALGRSVPCVDCVCWVAMAD